jgi:HdeA/HdeB family protein
MIARKIVLTAILACLASSTGAQDNNLNRTIDQYKCRDVMRESGANRDIAIAFLHGFLLGKSGSQNFNLDALHKQTEAFVEHCLSNPDGKAVDSMMAVKK